MNSWIGVLALSLIACGGGDEDTGKRSKSTAKLEAEYKGKPVTFAGAFAWTDSGTRSVQISLEAKPTTCEKLRNAKPWTELPTTRFRIVGHLQPDGSTKWVPNVSAKDTTSVTMTSVELKPGAKLRGTIDMKEARGQAMVKGELEAEYCGRFERKVVLKDKKVEPRPQKLKVTVSGVEFPLQGARVKKRRKGWEITFSSSPIACRTTPADLRLWLVLREDGTFSHAAMSGHAFKTTTYNFSRIPNLDLDLKGPIEGPGNLVGSASGSAEYKGYKLAFSGEFDAIRCEKK